MDLTTNQQTALDAIDNGGATTEEIADETDRSVSYAYDLVSALRRYGYAIQQEDGQYILSDDASSDGPTSYTAGGRVGSSTKAAITRSARELLEDMEEHLVEKLNELEPAVADGGLEYTPGGTDLVIHRTDDHFGEEVHNQDGDVVFDSDIAEARVNKVFDEALAIAEVRRDLGATVDTANLLLGGDIVTNEAIYEGQAHDIDADISEQLDRAADVYLSNIRRLSDNFETVQVVGQAGNHGELRVPGSSDSANADDILYKMMDRVVRASDLDNVTFIQSDATYYVDFNIREWNAHLRHGHDAALGHIGTSSAQQRWLSWLMDHEFDVAFRGHYHQLKHEPINGVPTVMGGSIAPQTEFEESRAISGRPGAAIHGSTDDQALAWTERVQFE